MSAVPATPVIELRGIRTIRGGFEALSGVSVSLAAGETLFAMGGTGSGKSILIKTAAGIALPDEGEVFYKGRSLARMSLREEAVFRKASGFVFQDAALWANQSLYDILALPVRLHEPRWGKAEVESAVRRVVEIVGYGQDLRARPADLSSGERKLIGLARALVLDPVQGHAEEPVAPHPIEFRQRPLLPACDPREQTQPVADIRPFVGVAGGGRVAHRWKEFWHDS